MLTHARVIVQVDLDVASDNTPEGPNKIVNLTRVRTADSIRNPDTVDANLVHSLVNRKEIYKVRSERVFRGEPDLDAYTQAYASQSQHVIQHWAIPTLALHELNYFNGGLGNIRHVFSV